MESHPVASLFPLMGDEEFAALKADIAANGQREPVWLHDGKLIDGRNRYRACTELGLEPKTEEVATSFYPAVFWTGWDRKTGRVCFIEPSDPTCEFAYYTVTCRGEAWGGRKPMRVAYLHLGLNGIDVAPADFVWRAERRRSFPGRNLLLTEPAAVREARFGFIYIAEAVGTDFVKVGFAVEPEARVLHLQTGCPHELRLGGWIVADSVREEYAFARRIRHLHVRGEWYSNHGNAVNRALAEYARDRDRDSEGGHDDR